MNILKFVLDQILQNTHALLKAVQSATENIINVQNMKDCILMQLVRKHLQHPHERAALFQCLQKLKIIIIKAAQRN